MIPLNPSRVLLMLGIKGDPELIDLMAAFAFAYKDASDKVSFLKDSLRKALVK